MLYQSYLYGQKSHDNMLYSLSFSMEKQIKTIMWCHYTHTYRNGIIIKTWCPTLGQLHKLVNTTGHTFALTQLLTGHGYHKQYLHRFHITDNDTCPCDNTTTQTFIHLLTQCPKYTLTRMHHEQYCHFKDLTPYSIDSILTDKTATNTFITHLTRIVDTLKQFNNT